MLFLGTKWLFTGISPRYTNTNPDLNMNPQTLCVVSASTQKNWAPLEILNFHSAWSQIYLHCLEVRQQPWNNRLCQGWNASRLKTISPTCLNAAWRSPRSARRVAVELARPLRSLPVRLSVQLLHHKMGHPVFALQLIHVISNLNGSGEQLWLREIRAERKT